MTDGYLTVEKEAVDEFTEKRSRFIGAICPVQTEEEALAFIRQKSKQYWDANHNVYAYVLRNGNICRFSDDGEPQGTAGVPALDVLQKEGLTDCVVVITRYFGGILLGGGGLVRAYSHAAKLAVNAGNPIRMVPCLTGEIVCDYAQYGYVPALVAAAGGCVTDTRFAEDVTVLLSLPVTQRKTLEKELTERSAARLTLTVIGERYESRPKQ